MRVGYSNGFLQIGKSLGRQGMLDNLSVDLLRKCKSDTWLAVLVVRNGVDTCFRVPC